FGKSHVSEPPLGSATLVALRVLAPLRATGRGFSCRSGRTVLPPQTLGLGPSLCPGGGATVPWRGYLRRRVCLPADPCLVSAAVCGPAAVAKPFAIFRDQRGSPGFSRAGSVASGRRPSARWGPCLMARTRYRCTRTPVRRLLCPGCAEQSADRSRGRRRG